MTKKERIAKLEQELAEVRRRLDVLEQWRIIFPQAPLAPYVPGTPDPHKPWTGDPNSTGTPMWPPPVITISETGV